MNFLRFLVGSLLLLCAVQAAPPPPRVLFLGDSHCLGAFGKTIDSSLREAGCAVTTSVTGGATPYYWLAEFPSISCDIGHWERTATVNQRLEYIALVPKLETLLQRTRAEVVVVETGTNLYSVLTSKRRTPEENVAEVKMLADHMGQVVTASGARLYWITPPSAHPERFSDDLQTQMRTLMKQVAGRWGRVFDSYAVTSFPDPYPETDGIHYGAEEAGAWGQAVVKDLVPFVLDGKPRNTTPAAKPGGVRGLFSGIFGRKKSPDSGQEPLELKKALPVKPQAAAQPQVRRPAGAGEDTAVEVEVVLTKKSALQHVNEAPYRSALGLYEYDVVRVLRGRYPFKTMRIAQLILMNGKLTSINDRQPGTRMTLEVELLSKYPSLEPLYLVDDLDQDTALRIYVPKL